MQMKPCEFSSLDDQEVDDALDRELRGLLCTCFTREQDQVFRERRYFSEPPRRRWLARHEGELVAHLAAHEKTFESGEGPIRVLGIAEVCVAPACRRQGLVGRMLELAHAYGMSQGFDVAFLFGLAQHYRSSGYRSVANLLRETPPTGTPIEKVFPDAMMRPLGSSAWPDGIIDLRGPVF